MIDIKEVREIFESMMFTNEEVTDLGEERCGEIAKIVQGVCCQVGFHPDRIESNRDRITELLSELPSEFKESGGGGWSFLNACTDKDGNLWGQQRDVDMLICIGLAIRKVEYNLPQELWCALPGGVPYFVVVD